MIKIKALNESGSSSSDEATESTGITREAQEEGLYQLYSDALKSLSSGDNDSARQMLLKLSDHLNSSVINQKLSLVNQLKYLTLKNLGLICTRDLNYFLDALEIDPTDVTLWLKTGQRAASMQNYQLSRNCYEEALQLSPHNWIAIDRLLDTYFVLNDFYSCFKLCRVALEFDDGYQKAQILLFEVSRLYPPIIKELSEKYKMMIDNFDENDEDYVDVMKNLRNLKLKRRQMFDDERQKQESKRPKLCLNLNINSNSNATFSSIGSQLLNIIDRIKRAQIMPSIPIDICFDDTSLNQNDSGGGESGGGSANTSADEGTNGVEVQKEKEVKDKDKEKKTPSLMRSNSGPSGTFPMEFLDKRRSSRVKNILNKSHDIDERNVSESILELLPESIKTLKEESSSKVGSDVQQKCDNDEPKMNDNQLISETDVIKGFIERVKLAKTRRKILRIYDIIEDYLCELSSSKGLILPSVFSDLYDIYRKYFELPCAPYCVIGRDIGVEHVWMVLIANEIKFNKLESMFLTQMMVPLEGVMSPEKYREYVIRLSTLRGIKEANNEFLNYALQMLGDDTEMEILTANKIIIKTSMIKSILESQSQESMTKMMEEQKYKDIIKLLISKPESELTAEEERLFADAIVNSEQWQKGIEIFSARNELNYTCLITIIKCLETGTRARLNYQLMIKLVKSAAEGYLVLPWICIYWGLIAEENATNIKCNANKLLKLGHQYLGKRGTCTSHNGDFLHLALQHYLDLDFDEDEIIKSFTCLYNYPPRKVPNPQSFSSSIHTSPHVKLKWENCEYLYNYFTPEDLPEFDSIFRLTGISADIESILLKIVDLVPEELQPKTQREAIIKHIEDGDELPEDTPIKSSPITENLYYFLADYYFKNKEFKKACDFYLNDIALNPKRFDSWAGSALARSSQLEQQLISGDNIESRFYVHSASALRCFERALKLDPQNTKLWIEYGNLAYNISSHASRLRKTALFMQTQTGPHIDQLQQQYIDMLRIAKNCFESANCTDSTEEIWLPYYMLGKVMEKRNLLSAIRYYEWAEMCLYADGTSYPKKIQYHNPPALAVEALECHYRIHAATLKFVTENRKFSHRHLRRIKMHLIRALKSPFTKQLTPSSATSAAPVDHDYATGAMSSSSNSFGKINDAVSDLMNDIVDTVCERELRMDITELKDQLITLCLNAMKRCLNRYPAHYKSIYRLAQYYHSINDNQTAKSLLLGSASATVLNPKLAIVMNEIGGGDANSSGNSQENVKISIIPGLFSEKKANNLFNGIWRIPIDDIDRPGSFNSHMFRSTFLLIRVCTLTYDYQSLCTISQQLSRTPDVGKKYLRDADRQLLARFSFESCSLLLKSHVQNPMYIGRERILSDVQKIVDRFIKANVFVNEANALIREIFQYTRR